MQRNSYPPFEKRTIKALLLALLSLAFVSIGQASNSAPGPSLKGDCVSDDTLALQGLLNSHRYIYLARPPGGCYLVSKTLTLQVGDYLYGASANVPIAGDPYDGVVIRLAPNSNIPLLKTFDSDGPPGGGNEFMAVENVVFDGNGASQTQELQGQALVDLPQDVYPDISPACDHHLLLACQDVRFC